MDTPNLKLVALVSLLITIGIFSLTFFVGSSIQQNQVDDLEYVLGDINTKIIDTENAFLLAEVNNNSCIYLENQIMVLNEDLKQAAQEAIAMENDLKTNTEEYKKLKLNLMATRIRYWLLAEKTKKICNPNLTTILYLYKTEEECEECYNQGIILEHVNSQIENNIMMSVIDMDEDLETIEIIKSTFNVTDAPTVIVDNSKVYRGLVQEETLQQYFCDKLKLEEEFC